MPVMILGLFGGDHRGRLAEEADGHRDLSWRRELLALALGVLDYTHTVAVWHIFLLAILLGLVNAVDMPAAPVLRGGDGGPRRRRQRGRPELRPSSNGARIVGPAIGGCP